jgi:hypothetical protein
MRKNKKSKLKQAIAVMAKAENHSKNNESEAPNWNNLVPEYTKQKDADCYSI